MKPGIFFLLLIIFGVVGCAVSPQETVSELDKSHPNYNTVECREARNIALQYDEKVAQRMGMGMLTGLLLGPVGIGLSAAADVREKQTQDALIDELKSQCTGEPRAISEDNSKNALETRLRILKGLLEDNLIAEDEYEKLRNRAIEEL